MLAEGSSEPFPMASERADAATTEINLPFSAGSLPPETWENIFSFTVDHRTQITLQNLALTCSAFNYLAQRLLFSTVAIHPYGAGYVEARRGDAITWRAVSMMDTQFERTMEKLRFIAQDRLVGVVESVLVGPLSRIDISTEEREWEAGDDFTAQILTFFFCKLFPKLARLRHLSLDRVHLESEYILAMTRPISPHYALTLSACSTSPEVRDQGLDARPLPIRDLVCYYGWLEPHLPDLYVPSPEPAILKTIQLVDMGNQGPQPKLLDYLQPLGPFPSLSAVQLLRVSGQAQDSDLQDWRPFLAASCPKLVQLHVESETAISTHWGPCTVPSLRLFRGSFSAALLYLTHPHPNLRHLILTSINLERYPFIPKLHDIWQTLVQLETLETRQLLLAFAHVFHQPEDVLSICTKCPRLRALHMGKFIELKDVEDVRRLFLLPYGRSMEFLSFTTEMQLTKELEDTLNEAIPLFSGHLRTVAPNLHCVVLVFRTGPRPQDPNSDNVFAFDAVSATRLAGAKRIDEWREASMRGENANPAR